VRTKTHIGLMVTLLPLLLTMVGSGSAAPGGPPCGASEYKPDLRAYVLYFWNCPQEEKEIELNNFFLWIVGNAYVEAELKVPRTMEEFLQSPYMAVVALEDIRNPYRNRPARFVPIEGYSTYAGWSEAQKREYLGDYLVYWSEGVQGLCLQAVLELSTLPGEPILSLMGPCVVMPKDPEERKEMERYHEERFGGMDNEEKTLYAACRYLENTGDITASYYPVKLIPVSFAERAKYHRLIGKLRNPYTGAAMKEVEHPSPGDFTALKRYDAARKTEVVDRVVCYNRDAKLIQPQRWFFKLLQESERIRTSFGLEPDPDIRIPEGVD
jgi:hypothetical protein